MSSEISRRSLRFIEPTLPESERPLRLSLFLKEARQLATVPVSGFRVGAAALAPSGAVYLGANQEFEGLPLNFTVHAEQAAIVNARSHGEKRLLSLAVSSSPCGHCRQFLKELASPLAIVLDGQAQDLSDYLPRSFALDSGEKNLLSDGALIEANSAEEAAMTSAKCSYSPYTKTRSGVALQCRSGKIYAGSLLESAAYNPTLTALQCALTLRALENSSDPIETAVLAERGKTSLAPLFPSLMLKIAPFAQLKILELQ
ncbi:MAG: cytidine deaminase [Pyramidobacter sp.]|jgi:cytidine deaminase